MSEALLQSAVTTDTRTPVNGILAVVFECKGTLAETEGMHVQVKEDRTLRLQTERGQTDDANRFGAGTTRARILLHTYLSSP